jgi:PPOX class probable F420-dependent enzyme
MSLVTPAQDLLYLLVNLISPREERQPMPATLTLAQRTLLESPVFGTIATTNTHGAPIQVLVWYMLRDDEIIIASGAATVKARNIQRTGWASLSVHDGPRYVTVRGEATIETDHERVAAEYEQIVRRYLPPPAADKWLAEAQANASRRIIIHLPLDHITQPQGRE